MLCVYFISRRCSLELDRGGGGGSLMLSTVCFFIRVPQDGDFSTSWSCTGGPRNVEQRVIYYECTLGFSLEYYRNIKQVKIGEKPRLVYAPRGKGRVPCLRNISRGSADITQTRVENITGIQVKELIPLNSRIIGGTLIIVLPSRFHGVARRFSFASAATACKASTF